MKQLWNSLMPHQSWIEICSFSLSHSVPAILQRAMTIQRDINVVYFSYGTISRITGVLVLVLILSILHNGNAHRNKKERRKESFTPKRLCAKIYRATRTTKKSIEALRMTALKISEFNPEREKVRVYMQKSFVGGETLTISVNYTRTFYDRFCCLVID